MSALKLTAGYSCPRFESCNAAYCPGLGGGHIEGEKVCLYLREAVKAGGEARTRAALNEELAGLVLGAARELLSGSGPLSRALRKASASGSMMEAGKRRAVAAGWCKEAEAANSPASAEVA
jgi:hypothetical protein